MNFPLKKSVSKLFAALAIAAPVLIFLLQRIFQVQVIPVAAKWPLLSIYVVICVALSFFANPQSPFRYLPHPPPAYSIFGNARDILLGAPKGDVFLKWIDTVPNSGLIQFDFWHFGTVPALFLTSPEALQEALITRSYDFEKHSSDRKLLESFIGRGLIVVEGAEHKLQRKSVAPAFSGKQINGLVVSVFWAKSKEFVSVVANQLHTSLDNTGRIGIVDISQWASHVTLDIIGLACVGKDFGSIYNAEDELVKQYETILKPAGHHAAVLLFEVMSMILPRWLARSIPFFKHVREAAKAKDRLRILCRELLEAKRRDMERESSKHIDVLSVLIRSGQFTDEGLVDQLLTYLAAGHETTAGALTWTLHLLAINPDVQARLRDELHAHFAQDAVDSNVNSLEKLPYLNAVINEQLRLFPAVPLTGRVAIKDTSLLGNPVPKGTIIATAPWAIQRSKSHWGQDAEEFRPDRWIGDMTGEKKSPMSVITFLHGPRSCIGQAFSRSELRCLVVAMVLSFEMKMADPSEVIEPVGLVTIKPKNGMRLWLRELSQ